MDRNRLTDEERAALRGLAQRGWITDAVYTLSEDLDPPPTRDEARLIVMEGLERALENYSHEEFGTLRAYLGARCRIFRACRLLHEQAREVRKKMQIELAWLLRVLEEKENTQTETDSA